MEISVKVKPRLVSADSREALLNIVVGSHKRFYDGRSVAHVRSSRYGKEDNLIRVYNLHKINTKYRQIKYKSNNVMTGAIKGRTRKTELVRKGKWIAYVYDIDKSVLEAAGLRVRQDTRNFTIEKYTKG